MTESSVSTIEHDIADLEKLIQEKKAVLEHEKSGLPVETKSEKEILHEVLGEKIQQQIPSYQSPLPTSAAPVPLAVEPPSYLSQELKEKIQEMIALVFSKN